MQVYTFNGENMWSDVITVRNFFDLSVYSRNPFNMTITLQRRKSEGEDWRDISVFTQNFEGYDYSPVAYQYRIGVKTGQYNFGSVEVSMHTN